MEYVLSNFGMEIVVGMILSVLAFLLIQVLKHKK